MKSSFLRRLAASASAIAAFTLSSCVDAPSAPEGQGLIAPNWVIAPAFALVGPAGPAMSPAQANALGGAFDLVDHFRLQAWRVPSGESVVDVIVEVTPGQDEYPLSANVEVSKADEQFIVTITALQGDVELFKAENVPVVATPVGGAGGGNPPTPPTIDLTFTGPGAQARSVELAPAVSVLAPGGSAALASKTLDAGGAVIANAPLSWESSNPAVVTVVDGTLTGASDGVATVTATSPTGLTATSDVYVVGGELAYVEGGVVKVRAAAGGDAATRSSGGGASGPAWSPDGGRLFYAQGGSVREADAGAALFTGAWPTVAPDGKTLAAERSGTIWFANDDGSNPTAGPSGTTPVWSDPRTLTVGGGSIQTVGVDGSGRNTVVSGEATFPAVGGGGIAFVRGGSLMTSSGPLANGVSGRPSWSANGRWLAVRGGEGLMVVPADGSAPPVLLPGLAGASDPAWKPAGSLVPPAGVSLTGFDPDPPIPGQVVRLVGSGFDDVIPTNNKVFWPTASGTEETSITEVTPSGVRTTMPLTVVAGEVRVVRRDAQATLGFEPTFGGLQVTAHTPWDAPVPGVTVRLRNAVGTIVAEGSTDASGSFVASGLVPGAFTVDLGAPANFTLSGAASRAVNIGASTELIALTLTPEVVTAELSPSSPRMNVFDEVPVTVRALDVNGDVVPTVTTGTWATGNGRVDVRGTDLSATLVGQRPSVVEGDATFTVVLGGKSFGFGATVTSRISGTVTDASTGNGVAGVGIALLKNGSSAGTTSTDGAGHYVFEGLLAGSYTVQPSAPSGYSASPSSAAVNLNDATPTGTADFSLHAAVVGGDQRRPGDVAIYKDYNAWFGSNKDEVFLQAAPFNFSPGSDYVVRPTADLKAGIPSETSIIILTSLSDGSGPLANVNDAAAQANLEAWVAGGGWLIVHAGDNVSGGYMVPGLTGIADDNSTCYGETLELSDHAFIRGPDGVLGTSDDLTDDNIDNGGRFCSDNHGSLAGILPAGAQVLMTEQGGDHRPTYATYEYGAGRVVVLTLTIEFAQHSPQTLINHFWWTIKGPDAPAPPALAPRIAPLKAMNKAAGAALPSTEVPPPGR